MQNQRTMTLGRCILLIENDCPLDGVLLWNELNPVDQFSWAMAVIEGRTKIEDVYEYLVKEGRRAKRKFKEKEKEKEKEKGKVEDPDAYMENDLGLLPGVDDTGEDVEGACDESF